MARTAVVVATIELSDGSTLYKTYRSDSLTISQLKREIKSHWMKNNAVWVGFGNGIYQNSYGAH